MQKKNVYSFQSNIVQRLMQIIQLLFEVFPTILFHALISENGNKRNHNINKHSCKEILDEEVRLAVNWYDEVKE